MTTETGSFSARLKHETHPLHDEAERHPLQRALLRGELSQEHYIAQLGQLWFVHRALEEALVQARRDDPSLAPLIKEEQFQSARLTRDLAYFGADVSMLTPAPATIVLCKRIGDAAAENPLAPLGFHYVLEGSNNGARFIARIVRKAYALVDEGTSFLDPYGKDQLGKWAEFKQALDALDLSEDDQNAIIAAAGEMFRAIAAIGDEVLAKNAHA